MQYEGNIEFEVAYLNRQSVFFYLGGFMLNTGLSFVAIFSVCFLLPGLATGQTYPRKPIRIVLSEPGGNSDLAARLIAQGLTSSMGQQVVVENRGGSAIIPAGIVASAPADGYTLLLYGSNLWLLPFAQDNVPYDPVKDLLPITLATKSPSVLAAHPSVAANSVKELIALAKAKPGTLNYASGAIGGSAHLAGELFKPMAKVNIVRVQYKGTAQAANALLAGEVQLMFANPTAVVSNVKAGRLKVLAVTSAEPSALLPGVPTIAATGVSGYEFVSTYGLFAPAKTPEAIIGKLNREILRVLDQTDVKDKLARDGAEVVGSSPQQFAAQIKSEMATMGKIIKDAAIHPE